MTGEVNQFGRISFCQLIFWVEYWQPSCTSRLIFPCFMVLVLKVLFFVATLCLLCIVVCRSFTMFSIIYRPAWPIVLIPWASYYSCICLHSLSNEPGQPPWSSRPQDGTCLELCQFTDPFYKKEPQVVEWTPVCGCCWYMVNAWCLQCIPHNAWVNLPLCFVSPPKCYPYMWALPALMWTMHLMWGSSSHSPLCESRVNGSLSYPLPSYWHSSTLTLLSVTLPDICST